MTAVELNIKIDGITLPMTPERAKAEIARLQEHLIAIKQAQQVVRSMIGALQTYCPHANTYNDGDCRGSTTYCRDCGRSW